jgi:lipopolysaccharide export system permease protein
MDQMPEQIQYERQHMARLQERRVQQRQHQQPETPEQTLEFDRHQLRLWRLRTEPYRRWSNGFNCLSFALIGIAVALWWRLSDNLTIFFVCFLPILLVFYPLLVLGEYIATKGVLPPWSVWLPNVVLIVNAMLVMRRVIRY